MTLDGGLATFRAVEQYPYHEIRRKLFKTMVYTGGSKDKRSGTELSRPLSLTKTPLPEATTYTSSLV